MITRRSWVEAVELPALGGQLLEGLSVRGAAAFESWLLSEQHRVVAATEAILHEAALGFSVRRSARTRPSRYAVRLLAIDSAGGEPPRPAHPALPDEPATTAAAERQFAACTDLVRRELGVPPGAIVWAALREARLDVRSNRPICPRCAPHWSRAGPPCRPGAVETGADSLRTAVRLADHAGDPALRVGGRLVLAETLIHSLRGFDEEGVAALQSRRHIALARRRPTEPWPRRAPSSATSTSFGGVTTGRACGCRRRSTSAPEPRT